MFGEGFEGLHPHLFLVWWDCIRRAEKTGRGLGSCWLPSRSLNNIDSNDISTNPLNSRVQALGKAAQIKWCQRSALTARGPVTVPRASSMGHSKVILQSQQHKTFKLQSIEVIEYEYSERDKYGLMNPQNRSDRANKVAWPHGLAIHLPGLATVGDRMASGLGN